MLQDKLDGACGFEVEDERMDIPVPTRGTIPDVDMVDGNIFSMDNHEEEKTEISNGRHCDVLLRSSEDGAFQQATYGCTYV